VTCDIARYDGNGGLPTSGSSQLEMPERKFTRMTVISVPTKSQAVWKYTTAPDVHCIAAHDLTLTSHT
jgi:hypothetical protein